MKDTNITFKLSESEKERIKEYAEQNDVPMSQVIRTALKDFFMKEAEKNGKV